MRASPVFGCGVAALSGFPYPDPWDRNLSREKTILAELDRWIANPGAESARQNHGYAEIHPLYVRKFVAVVTDGQKEALKVLMEHPRAKLMFKTMNYARMNYCFEITTDKCREKIVPDEKYRSFKDTPRTWVRKGSRSSTVWKSHANNKTTS